MVSLASSYTYKHVFLFPSQAFSLEELYIVSAKNAIITYFSLESKLSCICLFLFLFPMSFFFFFFALISFWRSGVLLATPSVQTH